MIAYLKGVFTSITPSSVIIDVQGVGYEVHISLFTYSQIQNLKSGMLLTHMLVKEDAHLLYGFADETEKNLFLLLISVSGIGANTARLILSSMKPSEIAYAILHGDSRALERIKGIGKKTAERAILELKDKIRKHHIETTPHSDLTPSSSTLKQDALEALQALGINKQLVEQNISKALQANPDLQLEELIKKVLKEL